MADACGKYLTSKGYALIKCPGHPTANKKGMALEHRKIWHDTNGPIPPDHVIHHRNGDRIDNRIENLELHTRSSHMREHYPNGWHFDPWNRGMAKTIQLTCVACGKVFERDSARQRSKDKVGRRPTCSLECVRALGRLKRWGRALPLEDIDE